MLKLNESPQTAQKTTDLLRRNYPSIKTDKIEEILETFATADADTILAAVRKHIADTATANDRDRMPMGHYPPSIAQLWTWVDRIEAEQRRIDRQASVPLDVQAEQDLSKPREFMHANCSCCSDTGVGRFFYDPHGQDREVWTWEEYQALPESQQERLHIASAVCDCRTGMNHPSRKWQCLVMVKGREMSMPSRARIEIIKKLARRRADRELYTTHHDNE